MLIFLAILISVKASHYNEEQVFALNDGLNLISDKLFVAETKTRGLGIFAKKNISKGDTIMVTNKELVFSAYDVYARSESFYENIDEQSTDLLAGRLLLEKHLHNNSLAHAYYSIIDKNPTYNGPYWTESEYKEYALRLGYAPVGLFDRKNFKKRIDFLIWKNLKSLKASQPHFQIGMFNRKYVETVYSQLYSHSIPFAKSKYEKLKGIKPTLKDENARAFIPYFDMINYKREKIAFKAKASEIFDMNDFRIKRILSRYGITRKSGEIAFSEDGGFDEYPFADYVIAKYSSESIWKHIEINSDGMVLKANRDYSEGEEIRYQQYPFSTNEELVSHSFISIPNPYEGFVLQINSSIANPDVVEICITELDCVNIGNEGILIFRFNWFQLNHRFLTFIRLSNLLASLKKEEISKKIDRIIHKVMLPEFYSGYREIEVWKTYFQAIESFLGFPTKISDDRARLSQDKKHSLKSKILRYAIYQKQTIYKHLVFSQKKWMKALHDKILMGNFKKMILATHDEEMAKNLNPEVLTADDANML